MRKHPTQTDFDDGGTPMWRARHLGPIVEARPKSSIRRLLQFYHRTSIIKLMAITFAITFFVPMAVLVFGILGAYWLTG